MRDHIIDDLANISRQFFTGNIVPLCSQSWRATYTKFGEDIGQSSALPIYVLHFR